MFHLLWRFLLFDLWNTSQQMQWSCTPTNLTYRAMWCVPWNSLWTVSAVLCHLTLEEEFCFTREAPGCKKPSRAPPLCRRELMQNVLYCHCTISIGILMGDHVSYFQIVPRCQEKESLPSPRGFLRFFFAAEHIPNIYPGLGVPGCVCKILIWKLTKTSSPCMTLSPRLATETSTGTCTRTPT